MFVLAVDRPVVVLFRVCISNLETQLASLHVDNLLHHQSLCMLDEDRKVRLRTCAGIAETSLICTIQVLVKCAVLKHVAVRSHPSY